MGCVCMCVNNFFKKLLFSKVVNLTFLPEVPESSSSSTFLLTLVIVSLSNLLL